MHAKARDMLMQSGLAITAATDLTDAARKVVALAAGARNAERIKVQRT